VVRTSPGAADLQAAPACGGVLRMLLQALLHALKLGLHAALSCINRIILQPSWDRRAGPRPMPATIIPPLWSGSDSATDRLRSIPALLLPPKPLRVQRAHMLRSPTSTTRSSFDVTFRSNELFGSFLTAMNTAVGKDEGADDNMLTRRTIFLLGVLGTARAKPRA
jgi:hypothetical protein